jgi:hypothetical protein
MEKTKQEKVHKILNEMAKVKPPITKDHKIKMNELENMPEIKRGLEKLRKLKVNGDWLFDNGFTPAGIMFGKLLDKD